MTIIIYSTQREPGNKLSSLAEPSLCSTKVRVILTRVPVYERGDEHFATLELKLTHAYAQNDIYIYITLPQAVGAAYFMAGAAFGHLCW